MDVTIAVALSDCAADHEAVALIAPLGIDTETQTFLAFEAPEGWHTTIVADVRTGLRAALMTPPEQTARGRLIHRFRSGGRGLASAAFEPEYHALTTAAAELATEAKAIAARAGGGRAGLRAIVADTSSRFSYGRVPMEQRFYYGRDAVPIVACANGNCIDINTYLVAALRAASYDVHLPHLLFLSAPPGPGRGWNALLGAHPL